MNVTDFRIVWIARYLLESQAHSMRDAVARGDAANLLLNFVSPEAREPFETIYL